jgi:hypothetical protein
MAGRLQNEDHKTLAELTGAGGAASQLLNDTKIYVTALSLNKQLSQAIIDGDIGGGGGGGSLQWIEAALAPISQIESNILSYFYQPLSAGGQDLYALVRVPASYQAGKQVKMLVTPYSPENTGTMLIRAQATLIRPGTDAVSSTANQRTTTNTAVTLSAGTVNIPQSVVLDLSSTTGQINGVSLAAGHCIVTRLYRDTDTAANDVRVPVFGVEVTFNG